MDYQARKDGEQTHTLYVEKMKDDRFARDQVLEFTRLNPPDKKYQRKQLIDWSCYVRTHGVRTSHKESAFDKPMTERAFKIWATNKQGLSPQDAQKEWDKFYDDPKIDRDMGGLQGALQLWIPNFAMRAWERETYIDNQQQEGSKQTKGVDNKDVKLLRDHVHRQDVSFSSEFLKQNDRAAMTVKRAAEVGSASAPRGQAESEGAGKVKRHKKNFNVERDATKLDKTMENDTSRVDRSFSKAIQTYSKALDAISAYKLDLEASGGSASPDRALLSYPTGLQIRRQLAHRFQDDDSTVVVLEYPGPRPSPGTPQSDRQPGSQTAPSPAKDSTMAASSDSKANPLSSLSGDAYVQAVKVSTVAQLLQEFWNRKPFDGDPDKFRTMSALAELKAGVYDIDSQEKYEAVMDEWHAGVTVAEQLAGSLHQTAADIISHIATKKRDRARQEKATKAASQAQELKKAREEARKAAEDAAGD